MVNYSDPHTIARETTASVNLHNVFTGLFFWEFFTTLDYEWDVIRGRRPYRRTIWIYTVARVATVLAAVIEMISFDTTVHLNCPTVGYFGLFLYSAASAAASLLIVLRIVAIWNREMIIILISMGAWVTEVAFFINGCARLHVSWSHEHNTCILLNQGVIKSNMMGSLIADVVLLLIMLVGLFRIPLGAGDGFGLGRVLRNQGLIWLSLAIVFEIPPTVFLYMGLNDVMNWILMTPSAVTMTIAATRMYRSLMDLGSSEISQESLPDSWHTISKMRVRSGPIPLSQIESLRTEIDQSPKTQTAASGSSSDIGTASHG